MYINEIDLSLSICCIIKQEGQTLTQAELADICGCSRSLIYSIEKSARKKIAKYCNTRKITPDLLIN